MSSKGRTDPGMWLVAGAAHQPNCNAIDSDGVRNSSTATFN